MALLTPREEDENRSVKIRFKVDDRFGAWSAGDAGIDLGRESALPIWRILLTSGQEYTLFDPYGRGLIEVADRD
jgi:hypothetical protein